MLGYSTKFNHLIVEMVTIYKVVHWPIMSYSTCTTTR